MARSILMVVAVVGGIFVGCSSSKTDAPPSPPAAGAAGLAGSGGSAGTAGSAGSAGKAGGGTSGSSGTAGVGTSGNAGVDGGDVDAGAIIAQYPTYDEKVPPAPMENDFTEEKAMLGKILFWDEQMGSDDTMACGTCHRTEAGGSDSRATSPLSRYPKTAFTATNSDGGAIQAAEDIHGSMGIVHCNSAGTKVSDPVFGLNPQVTKRKAPTYIDAVVATGNALFWDGRATTNFHDPDEPDPTVMAIPQGGALESQVLGPPLNAGEMACEGRTWANVVSKLTAATPLNLASDVPLDMSSAIAAHGNNYPDLFAWAFGSPGISAKRIAFAIATHERRLVSDQTPWDLYNAGNRLALTAQQERGYAVFNTSTKGNCQACHIPPTFTNNQFFNLTFIDSSFDPGRQAQTSMVTDRGAVKTPTVRNAGLREPGGLLHYGFGPGASLDAVVQAYNSGGMKDPGVTPNALIRPLNLTTEEMTDLVEFLRNGLTDPRVKNKLPPFDRPTLKSEK